MISLQLLELDEIQNWRHNPTVYVEMAGNGLFYPWSLDYAPKAERYRHIIARLEKIPALVEQAKKNLASAPEIWTTVAMEENDGNIGLIDTTLRAGAPEEVKAEYGKAAGAAIDALRAFNEYLKTDLAKRPGEWRLGKEKYAKKFGYVLRDGPDAGTGAGRGRGSAQGSPQGDVQTVRCRCTRRCIPRTGTARI